MSRLLVSHFSQPEARLLTSLRNAWSSASASISIGYRNNCLFSSQSEYRQSDGHASGSNGSDQWESAGFSGREGPQTRELQRRLLDSALNHVKQYGWSHSALVAAAHDLKLSPAVTGILPRREGQLVEHFISRCNADLVSELDQRAAELAELRTHDRLALALRLRLQMLHPHVDSWPQALAVATQPANLPHSLQLLTELVDQVWHAAGDRSTDINWYTKRALLAGVYTATELYMLTDYSPGYTDTWEALERRLHDAVVLGKVAADVKAGAGGLAQALTNLRQQQEQQQGQQQQQQQQEQEQHQKQQQQPKA